MATAKKKQEEAADNYSSDHDEDDEEPDMKRPRMDLDCALNSSNLIPGPGHKLNTTLPHH